MCGIAGVVSWTEPIDVAKLDSMNERLAHRGPDDSGTWISPDGRTGLASRRLAILDLSPAGHQPMTSDDGSLRIVFNGEIYNYVELRDDLRREGHRFRTGTDTEVLLAAYRHWGEACLGRLNGMFAFAMWDAAERRLFAARDRLGEKPFYYHHTPQRFMFASEIKALLVHPDVPRRPDPHAVARYISLALVDGEETTFFEGIRQLPPAHSLTLDQHGRVAIRRYWDIDLQSDRPSADHNRYVDEFRDLFLDAVRLRLRSDVAVGSSLSGGIDSSSIVCAINAMRTGDEPPQNTFSARHRSGGCDEGRFIDEVVARTGVRPHFVWMDGAELQQDVERFVWHQDEPVAHTSQYAQWKVMELAKQAGVTVLLDGQGADEVIGGYPSPTFGYRFAELLRTGRWKDLTSELKAFHRAHSALAPALRYMGSALLPPAIRTWARAQYIGAHGLLTGTALPPAETPGAAAWDGSPPDRWLKQALYETLTLTSLPCLLRFGDRNSMAFSREARLPFLDHRLVEFVFSLPSDQLVSGALTKVILRDAMRGLVPTAVLARTDKIGFATPERDWMTGPLRVWTGEQVEAAKRRGMLNPKGIDREWARLLAGANNSGNVWRIVNLELWCRAFIDAR